MVPNYITKQNKGSATCPPLTVIRCILCTQPTYVERQKAVSLLDSIILVCSCKVEEDILSVLDDLPCEMQQCSGGSVM